jgi:hypothetical protein
MDAVDAVEFKVDGAESLVLCVEASHQHFKELWVHR